MAKNTIADLDTTASNNTDVLGQSTSGTAAVSTIDTMIQNSLGLLARFYADIGGLGTVGGTADAITLTTASTYQALENGITLAFKAGSSITGASTINVDGLGAKAIRRLGDSATQAGDIVANGVYLLRYDTAYNAAAGAWIVLNVGTAASTSAAGTVELATNAETQTGSDTARAVTPAGLASVVTPWVAYTPTFTGFGTATGVAFFSRRVGDTLQVRGKFTAGTVTGTEGRITLGFNGTDGGITSSSTKVPSIMLCGYGTYDTATGSAWIPVVLIESNVGYFTFGAQSTAIGGLVKVNGNIIVGTGWVFSFTAEVPISGW